jgi:hypothetical protein
MNILYNILLLLAAHFSATAFVPASPKAWLLWPFDAASKPVFALAGGLPQQSGSIMTPLLAGLAVLGFVAAVFARIGWWVPSGWGTAMAATAAISSCCLFILYFSLLSLLPLVLNVAILYLAYTGKLAL